MRNRQQTIFRYFQLLSLWGGVLIAFPAQAIDLSDVIVPPAMLMKHMQDENLIVIDSRSENAYLNGHIAGAINIPVFSTYQKLGNKSRVASIIEIQKLFGESGISNNDSVIIYGGNSFIGAARMFWVFEVYGHKKVAVLSTGYDGWVKAKGKINKKQTNTTPVKYIAVINPSRISTKLTTRLAVQNKDKVLIDSRTVEEYQGLKSESKRFGHIPGAMSMPLGENITLLDGISQLKTKEQLASVYAGIDLDKKVITYCNIGLPSSVVYLVLRQLGHDVSQYDGAWIEWGNDSDLPITRLKH